MTNILTFSLLLCSIASLALASCSAGGGPVGPSQRAGAFFGGAIFNFTGPDAADIDARAVAREVANNRTYDFTTNGGFTLTSGASASEPGDNLSDFAGGNGTLSIAAGTATVSEDISSFAPSISNVELTGTFAASSAQQAIDDPGSDLEVSWELNYDDDGVPVQIRFDQVLTGTDLS